MTGASTTFGRDLLGDLRATPIRWRPAEGWLSVALLAIMGLLVAWAVDDAAWVRGQSPLTDFLMWAAVGGMIVGFVGAKVGWSRWTTHLVGAAFAALILPIIVGSVIAPDAGSWGELFRATASAVVGAWLDLFVLGHTTTGQIGHFLLVLAIFMWATCQFAMFAAFRHRRPVAATMVLGLALLVNVSATLRDQLPFLVLFSIAALFLLIRLHAFDEQRAWIRNRIGDPAAVSAMYLRGGTLFVIAAVIGALFLTVSANSKPLAGAWTGVNSWLIDAGRGLQRYFSFVQSVRGPTGVDFGPTAPISGLWVTDTNVAVRIELPPGTPAGATYYWRAATYDVYDGTGWTWSQDVAVDRNAGDEILAGTEDQPSKDGHTSVTVTVRPQTYAGRTVLSPGDPEVLDQESQVRLIGTDGFYATLDAANSGTAYRITGSVPNLGDADPKDLTKNRLRAAGTNYPSAVLETYLQVPDNAIGPDAQKLLARVVAKVPSRNPYDLAEALVTELHSSTYRYDANVTDLDCSKIGIVECFARFKRGYCQYYATTMAVLLRAEKIPTRLVQGFLPGERTGNVETVRDSNSHAWVQVYFPGYGWVDFDPTGGNLAQLPSIPNGSPVPIPSASPSGSGSGDPADDPRRSLTTPTGGPLAGPTGGPNSPGSGPFIVLALLLAVSVGGLALVAYRRGPKASSPDSAWRGITRLAGRLGFAPRPTQTVYEYMGVLGEMVPDARPHLETVATAKVEVAYGRHQLGDDRLRALRDAVGRLRITLLRLAFRRRDRQAWRRGRGSGRS